MGRVVAVANQKGGVAKTTTTHSLGAALAELGERVLLVDLDPQACLTYSLGIDSDTLDQSLHDVLAGRAEAADVLVKSGDLTALPATIDLAGAEVHLMTRTGREHVLARALKPMIGEYDTTMTRHILESFVAQAQIALHVHVPYGRNAHHIVECQFKALARALRYASELDPRQTGIPSTKGAL